MKFWKSNEEKALRTKHSEWFFLYTAMVIYSWGGKHVVLRELQTNTQTDIKSDFFTGASTCPSWRLTCTK